MRRAIQLARLGEFDTAPNPMVGAVIVAPDGRIIGEGYHRRCGEGHAEVNAVASVSESDRSLFAESTAYVTLEPCSHYGKTPPCAKLLIDCGIKRVVVGMTDPHDVVSGRGIRMLRDAGVEVVTGVLEDECRALNPRFIVSHTQHRPFITLKWAMSTDGYMDIRRAPGSSAMKFSTPLTSMLVHRQRALHDAIMVGSDTVLADNCRLDVRGLSGRQPLKVVLDRRGRISPDAALFSSGRALVFTSVPRPDLEAIGVDVQFISPDAGVDVVVSKLHARHIGSVLVEGGASVLGSFIDSGLWDQACIEISPVLLGKSGAVRAPAVGIADSRETIVDGRRIVIVSNQIVCSRS